MQFLSSIFRKRAFTMLLFAGCLHYSHAQVVDGNDNSPYTQIGIGDLSPSGFGRNLAMANTGVSMGSKYYVNLINPALLADNRLTILEFGLQARLRLLNSTEGSQRNFGGNFNYVAISFPITPKLTIAAGFKPFSTIRYSNSTVATIQGDTNKYIIDSRGQGSISQVFLSGGYQINNNWSVGLSSSFLFGNIQDEYSILTGMPVTSGFSIYYTKNVLLQSTMINGYNLQGGLLYRKQIISENIRLNIGLTGGFSGVFNSNSSSYLQKRIISNGGDGIYLRDTLTGNSNKINLPTSFTIGTSLNKSDEWTIGTDFTFQGFGNMNFRNNNSMQNAFNWSVGGEFNPIYKRGKSYLTRIVYRAGAYAGRTQYNLNGNSVNDIGFTVGFGAPLGKLFSYINLSAQIGTRGTMDNGSIKEDYFKFNLGLNVNDRWFIRPKVD